MSKKIKVTKEFKKMILKKAKIKDGTQADNRKLGNMGSWAMLFGNCTWTIPELGVQCKGTCGEYCTGCFNEDDPRKSPCYVAKSYVMHTDRNLDGTIGNILTNRCTVKLGHAYRTIAMTMFRDELLVELDMQLTRKRDKFENIRINESGEITYYEDLYFWCELARRHQETTFYLYTKNYAAVRKAIANNVIPSNLWINISVWHEYGIAEYMEFKSHSQIRAFVLVDDEWDANKYATCGLILDDMCPAYDAKGKMNHDITCDKCGKAHCFSNKNRCTGCYEH